MSFLNILKKFNESLISENLKLQEEYENLSEMNDGLLGRNIEDEDGKVVQVSEINEEPMEETFEAEEVETTPSNDDEVIPETFEAEEVETTPSNDDEANKFFNENQEGIVPESEDPEDGVMKPATLDENISTNDLDFNKLSQGYAQMALASDDAPNIKLTETQVDLVPIDEFEEQPNAEEVIDQSDNKKDVKSESEDQYRQTCESVQVPKSLKAFKRAKK